MIVLPITSKAGCLDQISEKSNAQQILAALRCIEDLRNQESFPIGTIVAFPGLINSNNQLPVGWKLCDGAPLNSRGFKILHDIIGTRYGDGYGGEKGEDFNLPDYRGYFLRGVDDPDGPGGKKAANRDPGKDVRQHSITKDKIGGVVGTIQTDMFQSHQHSDWWSPGTGDRVGKGKNRRLNHPTDRKSGGPIKLDDNVGTPRHGKETRPVNIYVNWIIKAK